MIPCHIIHCQLAIDGNVCSSMDFSYIDRESDQPLPGMRVFAFACAFKFAFASTSRIASLYFMPARVDRS